MVFSSCSRASGFAWLGPKASETHGHRHASSVRAGGSAAWGASCPTRCRRSLARGRGDVQHACSLGKVFVPFGFLQPLRQRIFVPGSSLQRCQQDIPATVAADSFLPVESFRAHRARLPAEPEKDDGIELETLCTMNRHDFDSRFPGWVRPAARIREALFQQYRVIQIAAAREFIQHKEESFCTVELVGGSRGRRDPPGSARCVRPSGPAVASIGFGNPDRKFPECAPGARGRRR